MAYTAELAYDSAVYSGRLAGMSALLRRTERGSRAVRGLRPFGPNSKMPCAKAGEFGKLLLVLASLEIAHSGRGLVDASLDGDYPI